MKNKIVIAGGSGFIGKALSYYYKNKGSLVVVLTRGESGLINGVKYEHWDAKTLGDW